MMFVPVVLGQFSTILVAPAPQAAEGVSKGNVVTLAQFEQAAQIAKMAADNGLNDLSIRAMTLALQAGPPVEAIQAMDLNQPFPAARRVQETDQSQLSMKIEERLTSIERLWKQKGVTDEAIYNLLKLAVLPERRPFEVFLYPRPLHLNPNQSPQSVGSLLVKAAVNANKVDEIKQLIEPRLKQPLGELSARVLLAQLALATQDKALAAEQINLLSKRLQQDSLQYSSELACHVAVPALSHPELLPATMVMLERAVDHFAQNVQQGRGNIQEEPMRSFRFALARLHFQNKDVDAGKKHLEEYLNFLTPVYARYGGDYGQYRRRIEMMKIAAEYARAGQRVDALDCLGRYADLPVNRNYGSEGPSRAGATILSGLASLPAAERYELLKTWTLPTDERKSIRVIGNLIPGDSAPEGFDALRGEIPRGPRLTQIASTADLLVSAAKESNRLPELETALIPHAEQNVENAKFLLLLTKVARGTGAETRPELQKYLDDWKTAIANDNNSQLPAQISDLVLARASMANESLRSIGQEMAAQFVTHASRGQEQLLMAAGRREYFTPALGTAIAARMNGEPWRTDLLHWTAGAVVSARTEAGGALPMWWVSNDDLIGHICGPEASHLYLKYPLTGEFDITCDAWLGPWGECDLGYGGLVYHALNLGSDTQIMAVGNRTDSIHKPDPPEVGNSYNRVRIEVRKDKVRYYVNQALIHEEPDPSSASPWLLIHCDRVWQTAIKNLQITGQPVIPQEVSLLKGETLLGWVSEFYQEVQPNRDPERRVDNDSEQQIGPKEFDWWAKDGILHGRHQPLSGLGKAGVQQSRLHYDRPLLNGEQIRYEFWYESGPAGSHVAPALDRLAFLLDADGVKLHWMTDGSAPEDLYGGLTPDNVLVDPSVQRGRVLLKDRDWNTVEVSMNDDTVTLSLNRSIVLVRKLETENSRQFGFYHDKHATSVQVRNVVLTGAWPHAFSPEIASNLLAPAHPRTAAERRAYGSAIDERFYAAGLEELLQQTRTMPLEAQYEALKNWVLPNDDHSSFRLYGDFTPDHGLPVKTAFTARIELPSEVTRSRRQKPGGELFSPALDLVDVASKLKRLDDLEAMVTQSPAATPLATRSKLALQILIATAQGDFAKSNDAMNQLLTLCHAIPESAPINDRWPEMVVGSDATRHPELRANALTLLTKIVEHQHKRGLGEMWEGRVTGLRDQCRTLIDTNSYPGASGSSPRGQWISAAMEWADAHARGPVGRWNFRDHGVSHLAGYSHDYLYYQSPLRGSFTVEAEVATFGWRETRLMYGAQWVGPQYTKAVVELGNLLRSWNSSKIEPALDFNEWCVMKLVVEPNKATFFINDRQVHEQVLADQPDPWLALMTWGNCSGGARMVRIKGNPEIPHELNLSLGNELIGWTANLYHDPMGNEEASAWIQSNGEITGRKFDPSRGRKRQSLLRYHRPLAEDAVVKYDFFYVPGQTVVHPAVGRMAFLMEPDGVKLHWLTDAQWDRTGWAPDNVVVEPAHRRGPALLPLKNDTWNELQLTVVGDTVRVTLNEVDVYEAPIPPTNQRQLGLFHYADETDVRVRNVVYRGNWPKELPSLKEQELSNIGPQIFDFAVGELSTSFEWNFQGAKPEFLKPWGANSPNRIEPISGGLKMIRGENARDDGIPCGFQWEAEIEGDFDVTLAYQDFRSQTEQTDWQIPRIELFLNIGGAWGAADNTNLLQVGHRRQSDGRMNVYTGHGIHVEDKYDWKYGARESMQTGGRLRFVRKGQTAYYLYAKPDTEEWQLLDTGPISAAALRGGNFCLRAEMPTSSGEVVFTQFTIKSRDQKLTDANPKPKPYEFAEGVLSTKFVWDFQGPKPSFLKLAGAVQPNRMEPVSDGLKLVRGEKGTEEGKLCGFVWNAEIKGDLEATIRYRDFVSKTEQKDWQVPRIETHFDIGGGWNDPENTNIIQGGLKRDASGKLVLFAANRVRVNTEFEWKNAYQNTDASSGSLRFVRKGKTAYYLHSKTDLDRWDLIYEGPIGTAALKGGNFGLRSEIPTSTGEIVLTEFVLKTTKED